LKHSRTVDAIMYRLETEGIIDDWENARGFSPRRSPRNKA